jgi:hypothetical protein
MSNNTGTFPENSSIINTDRKKAFHKKRINKIAYWWRIGSVLVAYSLTDA